MPGTFPRGLAIPTCIMSRTWCTCRDACRDLSLAVFFGVGGGENVPSIPGACATHNFPYLVVSPLVEWNCEWVRMYELSGCPPVPTNVTVSFQHIEAQRLLWFTLRTNLYIYYSKSDFQFPRSFFYRSVWNVMAWLICYISSYTIVELVLNRQRFGIIYDRVPNQKMIQCPGDIDCFVVCCVLSNGTFSYGANDVFDLGLTTWDLNNHIIWRWQRHSPLLAILVPILGI